MKGTAFIAMLLLGPARAFAQADADQPRVIDAESQNMLVEMWQRKIVSTDMDRFSPEDMALLGRIRRAEASGAIELLKARGFPLKNLIVVRKRGSGFSDVRLRLTREGFTRYQIALAQEALTYFESKGVDVKWAFHLRDLEDHPLFDSKGMLTEAGEKLYQSAKAGEETFWKNSAGVISGNRPKRGESYNEE